MPENSASNYNKNNMHTYKYRILYKTTNKINNKIYVGMHSTDNIEDKYLGSGWIFKQALNKYGREAFKRTILMVFDNREEAREVEALMVGKEFIKRPNTYNIAEGGMGVQDQWGENNPMYGRLPKNACRVVADHLDGTVRTFSSIQECASFIHINRANIRHLIKKGIRGRRGWKVTKI